MNRVYGLFLLLLVVVVVIAIILNCILEIGKDVQKSPYARFIVKKANFLYDFLVDRGIDVKNVIVYLIVAIVPLSFALTLLSFINLVIQINVRKFFAFLILILVNIVGLTFLNTVISDTSKIFFGASYFNKFYLALFFFLLILVGLHLRIKTAHLDKELKKYIFDFPEFVKIFLFSCLAGGIFLSCAEYLYLTVRFNRSFIDWQDYIYTFIGGVAIGFFTSLFYFTVFIIVFYLLYCLFKHTNSETFGWIGAFFISIFTIILIYYWGFNYIRSKTPIFSFVPPVSLMVVLYSFSVFPAGYIIFSLIGNVLRCREEKIAANIMPLIIIGTAIGWLVQLPAVWLGKMFIKDEKKLIKIVLFVPIIVCVLIAGRIIRALFLEKYLSHAYVVHYISGRYLVIIWLFLIFLIFNLLRFSCKSASRYFFDERGYFKSRVLKWFLILCFGCGILGYILLGLRENVRFLIVKKSEVMSSSIKTLRYLLDFDGDEFSSFFYGGDPTELDGRNSPYFRKFFATNRTESPVRDTNYFNLYSQKCNPDINRISQKFNLIIILLDGLRKDYVGIYGNTENLTPNLDNFAKESIVFKNAYSNTSLSIVAYNILYSGCYGTKNLKTKVMLPDMFNILCNSGKFDTFIIPGFLRSIWQCPSKKVLSVDEETGAPFVKLFNEYYEFSSVQFKTTLDLLDKVGKNDRIFLHIISLDTHFPFEKPMRGGKFFGSGMINIYKNHVSYQDDNFGEFIQTLKEKNLYDRSIIAVFSDHGSELKDHGRVFHGYHLYQESVAIPFIIRIPSVKPKTIEIPFSTVDFLPTILSIFGICEEQNLRFDGHDFSNIIFDSRNVETMKNDLIFMMDGLEDRYALLYKNRYKLIYNRTENIFELYDLEIDPGEIKNIVDVKKELFRKLKMILYDFLYQGFHIYGDVNIFKRVPENEKNY